MVLAIRKDAARPLGPLSALLSVEEDPALRSHLEALIRRHGRIGRSAVTWGNLDRGGAALTQRLDGEPPETLVIAWSDGYVESMRIESRTDLSFFEPGDARPPAEIVDRMLPMIWRYLQGGEPLPPGIARFAEFFSLR